MLMQSCDREHFAGAIADPLADLVATHAGHRALCDDFAAFCGDPDRWDDVGAATGFRMFFAAELPRHAADEEEILLPLLCRRGLLAPDDPDLAASASQHARDRLLIDDLVQQLSLLAAGQPPSHGARFVARGAAFVHGYRRHMAQEDKALLPRAACLDAPDRRALQAAMAARRGRG